EDEPRDVRCAARVVEDRRVQGGAERIRSEDVQAAVADVGRRRDRVEDALDRGPDPFLRRAPARRVRVRVGGSDEVEPVCAFGFVELQRACDGLEHVVGHAGRVPALEARVVLDADAREHRCLLATAPAHAPVVAVDRKAGLLRRDPCSPGGEEVSDVLPRVHGLHATDGQAGEGGPASTPLNVASLAVPNRGSIETGTGRSSKLDREDVTVRAAIFNGPKDITVGERPDPIVQEPTDAVVRVTLACVCGSDLWYYRGLSPHSVGSIGHEFIGTVEDVGAEVTGVEPGDFVVAPFIFSDMSCPHCRNGSTLSCIRGGNFGNGSTDGGQGEAVRVPLAGSTLVPVAGSGHAHDTLKSLLTLTDVMATGHHAAVCGGVTQGSTVAVVGDGAVGLCAVLASKRLGAERIIALSRHADRQAVARKFGATDVIAARGDEAIEVVLELTAGVGVDSALECVGTQQSIDTAAAIARPGSTIGIVGVPHGDVPFNGTFFRNIGWSGGPAPARIYIPELLDDVLDGRINPGLVLDYEPDLDQVADAH